MPNSVIYTLIIIAVITLIALHNKYFPAKVKAESKDKPKGITKAPPKSFQERVEDLNARLKAGRAKDFKVDFREKQRELVTAEVDYREKVTDFYDAFYSKIRTDFVKVNNHILSFSFLDITIDVQDVLYVQAIGGEKLACREVFTGHLEHYVEYKEREYLLEIEREEVRAFDRADVSNLTLKERADRNTVELSRRDVFNRSIGIGRHFEDSNPALIRTNRGVPYMIMLACADKTYQLDINPLVGDQVMKILMDFHKNDFNDQKATFHDGPRKNVLLQGLNNLDSIGEVRNVTDTRYTK